MMSKRVELIVYNFAYRSEDKFYLITDVNEKTVLSL